MLCVWVVGCVNGGGFFLGYRGVLDFGGLDCCFCGF